VKRKHHTYTVSCRREGSCVGCGGTRGGGGVWGWGVWWGRTASGAQTCGQRQDDSVPIWASHPDVVFVLILFGDTGLAPTRAWSISVSEPHRRDNRRPANRARCWEPHRVSAGKVIGRYPQSPHRASRCVFGAPRHRWTVGERLSGPATKVARKGFSAWGSVDDARLDSTPFR